MRDIKVLLMKGNLTMSSAMPSHLLTPKECVRLMAWNLENFRAPPRGNLELLADELRDLGQKVIRCLHLTYLRGQGQNHAEFGLQCIKFVSVLMGAAFLRVLHR